MSLVLDIQLSQSRANSATNGRGRGRSRPYGRRDRVTSSRGAEARLPAYLTTDSDVSEDNVDLAHVFPIPGATHDDEAGTSATATTSNTPVPVPPPTVTTAVPNTLARILDTLTHQQGSMQAEQAHRHKVQTILFREIRQQQDAMRMQVHQQQMFTFFSGCFGTIYNHVGLPFLLLNSSSSTLLPLLHLLAVSCRHPWSRSLSLHSFRQGCLQLKCLSRLDDRAATCTILRAAAVLQQIQ